MYFLPFYAGGVGWGYWGVMIAGALVLGGASWFVKRTYRRWSGVRNSSGLLGHKWRARSSITAGSRASASRSSTGS